MIAEVVPYARTIRGKDAFDYCIPADIEVERGSGVWIRFRNQNTWGVVWSVKKRSALPMNRLQAVLSVSNPRLSSDRVRFIQWFARYYCISLPHALKTIEAPRVKRVRGVQIPFVTGIPSARITIPSTHIKKIREAIGDVQQQSHSLVLYNHSDDRLILYRGLIQSHGGPVLCIVPEYTDVPPLLPAFKNFRVIVSGPRGFSPSQHAALVSQITEPPTEKPLVIIGTKQLAFLPPPLFSLIILDQEEASSHKQYDMNPRYHVRLALWKQLQFLQRAQHTHRTPHLVWTSHAPSIDAFSLVTNAQLQLVDIRRPWKAQHIQIINMEDERQRQNRSWFSEACIQKVAQSKKSFLFLNRTGEYAIAYCQDCHAVQPLHTLRCSQCQGNRMRSSRKGTRALEQELRTLFAHKKIIRVDREQDLKQLSPALLADAEMVVGTEKVLRLIPMSAFDLIVVISIDHLLLYPHFQSHERVLQLLSRLAIARIPLLIQTHVPEHPVIVAGVTNDVTVFARTELQMRMVLSLPPCAPASRLINTTTREITSSKRIPSTNELPQNVIIDRSATTLDYTEEN